MEFVFYILDKFQVSNRSLKKVLFELFFTKHFFCYLYMLLYAFCHDKSYFILYSPTNPMNPNPCSDLLTNLTNPLFLHSGENPAIVLCLLFFPVTTIRNDDMTYSLRWKPKTIIVLLSIPFYVHPLMIPCMKLGNTVTRW